MVQIIKDENDLIVQLASAADPKLVIIFFTNSQVPACKEVAPIAEKLSVEFESEVVILAVDAAKSDEEGTENVGVKWGVEGVPTFAFVKDHQIVEKVTGDVDTIEAGVRDTIAKLL
ncbi:thioredoxin II [Penicillium taxi]|uniref:thioredoxin II n=1 Tax=Penicillium taxi TaxID=168475 RepID=UPI0025451B3D|nr:thioredoxin II [Penicillium taxi]KAJ5893524.1 thioredoxin II [Penicillium taxi]